jgi:PhoH-like ATPase
MNRLYKNGSLPISELNEYELEGQERSEFLENEFLQIMALENNQSALAWIKGDEIVLLDGDVINDEYMGLTARNAGQRFMMAALNAPAEEIPLVIVYGPAGTGKTLVSEAVGLSKTYGSEFGGSGTEYKSVYITRSNTLPENENLGFLPGDLEEKMGPLLAPFIDNLEALLKMNGEESADQVEMMMEDLTREGGPVKIVSLAYIRGRSIPDSFIILDEAQNTTAKQIKTIITRAGMNTKIVLLGDPEQIDAPRLSKKMNGLVYAAEKLKGQKLTAVITMTEEECMRSELAKVAERLL